MVQELTFEEFLKNETKQITKEEYALLLLEELQRNFEEEFAEDECLQEWLATEEETIASEIIDELFDKVIDLERENEGLEMEIEFLNDQLDMMSVVALHNEILIDELEIMQDKLVEAQNKLEITQKLLRVYLGLGE